MFRTIKGHMYIIDFRFPQVVLRLSFLQINSLNNYCVIQLSFISNKNIIILIIRLRKITYSGGKKF